MEILIILIPLVVFLIGAYSVPKKSLEHPDDFFIAYKKIGAIPFSSSSIAYSFQVSTISPFLLWSASSWLLVPAVNSLCWGLGILFFYFSFSKIKQFLGKDLTLHGFLGTKYGPSVRLTASVLTIIGFTGYIIAETYFGSRVLLSLISETNIFYILVAAVILYIFAYVSYGGQLSSIRTDQLQLMIAYIGVFGLMIYFFYLNIVEGLALSFPLFLGALIILFFTTVIFLLRKGQFVKFSEEDTLLNKFLHKSINLIISLFLIALAALALIRLFSSNIQFNFSKFINLDGFGVSGLIALIILPLAWQFVDLTNWQRILAVKPTNQTSDSLEGEIRKGLKIYAIESPFTWLIFIFFGLLATSVIKDLNPQELMIEIPKKLIGSANLLERLLGYSFIISILSIMLSTVDSFIVGIIFTFVYDTNKKTRSLLEGGSNEELRGQYKRIRRKGNIFGLIVTIGGILLFIWFSKHIPSGGEFFINLLLSFYTAQLSFFPLVMGILFAQRTPHPFFVQLSLIGGSILGIGLGLYSLFWDLTLSWYPIILSISFSGVSYVIGLFFGKKPPIKNPNDDVSIFRKVKRLIAKYMVFGMLFAGTIIYGVFGTKFETIGNRQFEANWEFAAVVSTVLYTIYLYLVGFFRKDRAIFKNFELWEIGITVILLGFAAVALGTVAIMVYYQSHDLRCRLGLLFFAALMFCIVDRNMEKSSKKYKFALRYSDGPITIAFLIMFGYSLYLFDQGVEPCSLSGFFGGAIAFQMMLSNAIWAITENTEY